MPISLIKRTFTKVVKVKDKDGNVVEKHNIDAHTYRFKGIQGSNADERESATISAVKKLQAEGMVSPSLHADGVMVGMFLEKQVATQVRNYLDSKYREDPDKRAERERAERAEILYSTLEDALGDKDTVDQVMAAFINSEESANAVLKALGIKKGKAA